MAILEKDLQGISIEQVKWQPRGTTIVQLVRFNTETSLTHWTVSQLVYQ